MAKSTQPSPLYQLKVTLSGIRPPIWRRLELKDCTLAKLHRILIVCMDWDNLHLHAFDIAGEQYGEPDPDGMMEVRNEVRMKLSQLIDRGIKKFTYTYDFGDNWEHVIQVEKTTTSEAGVRYPRCVKGKRASPPEDCGGPWGYASFLETLENPCDPQHQEMIEWIGGEFDPEKFDINAINEELKGIR